MLLAAFASWFTVTGSALAAAALSAAAIYLTVILYTRLAGVRSFAKMSGFDFAMTIAVGSVVGSTALSDSTPLPVGMAVLAVLFALQWGIAKLRITSRWMSRSIDNEPILVMLNGRILEDNMRTAAITHDDLMSKLREANVMRLEQVRAMVIETTGSVTVLHAEPGTKVDLVLLDGVNGQKLFRDAMNSPG